jgi:exoribonuclease-2
VVRVDRHVTYEEASEPPGGALVERLLPVARSLREARRAKGAALFSLPRLKVTLDALGEPVASLTPSDTPAQLVVSELMVLYNARLGERLAAAGAPAFYRAQPEPIAPLPHDPADPLFPLLVRRRLPPTTVLVEPAPQRTMGLEAYVQGSSPIRRLGDLIAQRQLLALLDGRPPPHEAAALEAFKVELNRFERRARHMEEERRRYWICRWLEARAGPLEGVVSRNGPMVYLPSLDREVPCKPPPEPVPVGTAVRVRVERCDPRKREVLLAIV